MTMPGFCPFVPSGAKRWADPRTSSVRAIAQSSRSAVPSAAVVERGGQRADVHALALVRNLEDDVAQADAAALAPEGAAQTAIELLGGRWRLQRGGLDRLHRRQHRHRPGVVGCRPCLPAGAGRERGGHFPLGLAQWSRGRLVVEQLQRKGVVLEAEAVLHAEAPACVVEAPDDGVRPRAAEIGPDSDRVGRDLHRCRC